MAARTRQSWWCVNYVIRDKVERCWNDSVALSLVFKEISKHLDTSDVLWYGSGIEVLDEKILSYRRNYQSDYYFDYRLYNIHFYNLDHNYITFRRYSNEANKDFPYDQRTTIHRIPDTIMVKIIRADKAPKAKEIF